jgi:RNA polymerase sigma-70 factor (ECF subfamily)
MSSLDPSVSEAIAAARLRWPGIDFDEAAVNTSLATDVLPPFAVELVLAHACLQGNEAAIRVFHREMFERVDRVLSRLGVTGADADDVKQDVRAKLLLVGERGDAKLALYQGTGPLAHWVASVAGREALGAMRRRRPLQELGDDDLLADAADDPGLLTLKTRHSADFKAAFQGAVAELEPRDRAILRALIVDERTVGEIANVYGIHRVTASRRITEIRQALLQGTRKRLRISLQLDEPSLESAIRLIDSNLDLSLYRLLTDAA